ncbi:MAG: FHA domain-containing protein [Pseudomonadota bacterium]
MAKKPTFVSPHVEKDDAGKPDAGSPAPTRLYRDPADGPSPDRGSVATNPTRIMSEQPAPPPLNDGDGGATTRLLVKEPDVSDVTRLVSPLKAPGDDKTEAMQSEDRLVAPVVGWLVVVDGPGRGTGIPFGAGMNAIGRGADNAVVLDFGDEDITDDPHAFIVYDEEKRSFHVTHAGQNSVVRLDDQPLLEAKHIDNGAHVRIGQTTLRFTAFCGSGFDWSSD